jgi:hypothetical protein
MKQSWFYLLSILCGLSIGCGVQQELPTVSGPFGILTLPADYESHRASGRPQTIEHDAETILMDVDGEGCLRHFWLTIGNIRRDPRQGLRLTLRVYTDGNDTPNVETPVTPYFGIHHGHDAATINAPYLQVTARSGFNSYFPMPYKKGMRVTLQNETADSIGVWYQLDFHTYAPGTLQEPRRFHASYRRVNRAEGYGRPYHVGHGYGAGVIVGLSLGLRAWDGRDAWFHCGGDQFLIDGNTNRAHVLSGIGGEDFFGTAWGQDVYSNHSIGTPYYDQQPQEEDAPRVDFAAYRFFDKDPVAFTESFSYDFGSLENDMSSVLYWYQTPAAEPTVRLPNFEDRLAETLVPDGAYDIPRHPEISWQVCGPFSCTSKEEFDRAEFPERGIDLSQTAPADFGVWAKAVQVGHGGPSVTKWSPGVQSMNNFVDLVPWNRSPHRTNGGFPVDCSAYAVTTMTVDRAGEYRLRIGHDDWLRLWVNGEVAYEGDEHNGMQTTVITVNLQAGENQLMVKSANRENFNFRAWVFLLDLLADER